MVYSAKKWKIKVYLRYISGKKMIIKNIDASSIVNEFIEVFAKENNYFMHVFYFVYDQF